MVEWSACFHGLLSFCVSVSEVSGLRDLRGATWTSTSARELRVIADALVGISFRVLRALSVSGQMIRILLRSQDLRRRKEL